MRFVWKPKISIGILNKLPLFIEKPQLFFISGVKLRDFFYTQVWISIHTLTNFTFPFCYCLRPHDLIFCEVPIFAKNVKNFETPFLTKTAHLVAGNDTFCRPKFSCKKWKTRNSFCVLNFGLFFHSYTNKNFVFFSNFWKSPFS